MIIVCVNTRRADRYCLSSTDGVSHDLMKVVCLYDHEKIYASNKYHKYISVCFSTFEVGSYIKKRSHFYFNLKFGNLHPQQQNRVGHLYNFNVSDFRFSLRAASSQIALVCMFGFPFITSSSFGSESHTEVTKVNVKSLSQLVTGGWYVWQWLKSEDVDLLVLTAASHIRVEEQFLHILNLIDITLTNVQLIWIKQGLR